MDLAKQASAIRDRLVQAGQAVGHRLRRRRPKTLTIRQVLQEEIGSILVDAKAPYPPTSRGTIIPEAGKVAPPERLPAELEKWQTDPDLNPRRSGS